MSEQYRFFDSVDGEDERYYTADEFAEYFRQLITSGIFNGGENLRVRTDGTNMSVQINEGYAWLEGYLYKIDTEPLNLTLDSADPALNRIDRIVIRLDKSLEKRYVKAFILRGTATESPIAPPITRDENIYEISLAQIRVIAGKSFIGEAEITDERFDEKVCGLVNSLIKVDTSHLIKKWEEWLIGIKDETFVPKGNFKEGFIKTKEDIIHAIPSQKVQLEEGWPVLNMAFNNTAIDEEGCVYIKEFTKTGTLFKHDIVSSVSSPNLFGTRRIATPFSVSRDTNRVKFSMILKRNSIGKLNSIIYEADDNGLPDTTREIGKYFSNVYGDIPSHEFSKTSWEIPINEILVPEKKYILVIYGTSSEYYINAEYANTPGESNYMYTTNGVDWIKYEYTPFLEVDHLEDEGSVVINKEALRTLDKHLSIHLDIKESIDSIYRVDVLNMENEIIKPDVKSSDYLLDLLDKDIKIKVTILRVLFEEPKIFNFKYKWISSTEKALPEQAIIPSEKVILIHKMNTNTANTGGVVVSTMQVGLGGRYRLKCELASDLENRWALTDIYLDEKADINKIGAGSIRAGSYEYVPVSIDLGAIPPNAKILVVIRAPDTYSRSFIRNISLHGEEAYLETKLIL